MRALLKINWQSNRRKGWEKREGDTDVVVSVSLSKCLQLRSRWSFAQCQLLVALP